MNVAVLQGSAWLCSGSDALGGLGEGMPSVGIPGWGVVLGIGNSQAPAQDSGGSGDRGAWALVWWCLWSGSSLEGHP